MLLQPIRDTCRQAFNSLDTADIRTHHVTKTRARETTEAADLFRFSTKTTRIYTTERQFHGRFTKNWTDVAPLARLYDTGDLPRGGQAYPRREWTREGFPVVYPGSMEDNTVVRMMIPSTGYSRIPPFTVQQSPTRVHAANNCILFSFSRARIRQWTFHSLSETR